MMMVTTMAADDDDKEFFLFFLLNVHYTWHRIHHRVSFPPEFRSNLILPWNDLIPMCVPPESGNSAENPEFRKMRTGINRNTGRNAQPRVAAHRQRSNGGSSGGSCGGRGSGGSSSMGRGSGSGSDGSGGGKTSGKVAASAAAAVEWSLVNTTINGQKPNTWMAGWLTAPPNRTG
jgi:uncharacterized membrane protein YgcG